jgi:hypothetical protein
MTPQEVEQRAEQILRNTETYRAPIPMEALLNHLNLSAEAAPLGQNVSGMLVAKDERGSHRLQLLTCYCSTTIHHRS